MKIIKVEKCGECKHYVSSLMHDCCDRSGRNVTPDTIPDCCPLDDYAYDADGYADGHDQGYEDGHEDGYKEGYDIGYEDGQDGSAR